MDATYRARQLAHIDECIALTERVPTEKEKQDAARALGVDENGERLEAA